MQSVTQTIALPVSTSSSGNANVTSLVDIASATNIYVQIAGTFSATYTIEGSADGTNWTQLSASFLSAADEATVVSSITTPILMKIQPIYGTTPYLRFKCTVYASGTPTAIVSFADTRKP